MTPQQITQAIATLRAARTESPHKLRSTFAQLPEHQKATVYQAMPEDLKVSIDTRTLPAE